MVMEWIYIAIAHHNISGWAVEICEVLLQSGEMNSRNPFELHCSLWK
jgi:hypothetical protein